MGHLTYWYGADPAWRLPFEREAKRYYGRSITVELHPETLLYRHRGLDIRGRREPVPVTIRFDAKPCYPTYGLRPQDYPHVFADAELPSPHRMPDHSLCLFYPGDPVERRWISADGLLSLLHLSGDHIFKETYWRRTGGRHRGIWLGEQAPHGYKGKAS